MFVFAFFITRRNASRSGEGKKECEEKRRLFHKVILKLIGLKYLHCFDPVNKKRARRRVVDTLNFRGLLFFNFFREAGVFHRGCGATCFTFVLHFIELPFQLVDQFVNW